MPRLLKCICLFFPYLTLAQVNFPGSDKPLFAEPTQVFIDSTQAMDIADILRSYQKNRFRISENFGDVIGVGRFDYWVVLKVKNPSPSLQTLVFEIPIARLDSFSVYRLHEEHLVFEGFCPGTGASLRKKPLYSYSHAVSVTVNPGGENTFFLKLNKSRGSVRSAVILHTPYSFEMKQLALTRNVSFLLILGVLVALSSILIGYSTGNHVYFLFSVLTLFKLALHLQFFNYSQIMNHLGLKHISTSAILLVALYFQYSFFKLYFGEKQPKSLPALMIILLFLDGISSMYFKREGLLYLCFYFFIFLFALLFFYKALKKIKTYRITDSVPLIAMQALVTGSFALTLLGNRLQFANGFFRKHDHILLFSLSILEMGLYFVYLVRGVLKISRDNLYKSKKIGRLKESLQTIEQTERRKIAADLHDDLGSTLALLKDSIDRNREDAHKIVKKAIADLRSISHQLMPPDFETFGFRRSLEKFIVHYNQNTKTHVALIYFDENHTVINTETGLNLFRILTELLHNALKHGTATEIKLEITCRNDALHVAYEESGNFISNPHLKGLGHKSIYSRLQYIQARVLEFGNLSNGFSLIFEVPADSVPITHIRD